ncbi:EF-hand domain-containing protein [Marinobacter fonticola]|uniref:EF-hand domain-containing protein n=1 Tax=Marinobacter fonticola TaxID=2603215 RepID=UPI0011E78D51|nr:EF-hand domain-containing protein [Marinobacter fonticola]
MKIRKMTLAAAISTVLVAPMALAGTDSMDNEGSSKADREGATTMEHKKDGMAMQSPRFEQVDTDGNGVISEEELNMYGSTAAGGSASAGTEGEAEGNRMSMESRDTNNDGEITRQEFKDGADGHDESSMQ